MVKIRVSNKYALIDNSDLTFLSRWNWYLHKTKHTIYARGYLKNNRKTGLVYMHRLIMGAINNQEIDHINGDGLDNRHSNLRYCTRTQNNANRKQIQSKTSKFKGVHLDANRWRAEITYKNKRYRLGRFNTQEEAANAYVIKAKELFGEFAFQAKINQLIPNVPNHQNSGL